MMDNYFTSFELLIIWTQNIYVHVEQYVQIKVDYDS
jgi:hypothetical protein